MLRKKAGKHDGFQDLMRKVHLDSAARDKAMFDRLCEVARIGAASVKEGATDEEKAEATAKANEKFNALYREYNEYCGRKLDFNYSLNDEATMHDRSAVIMQMAMEGNHDAVAWLASEKNSSGKAVNLKKAVEGYARVNDVACVDKILYDHNFRNDAARGYGFAGNSEQVSRLEVQGINLWEPAYGMARAGKLEDAKAFYDAHKNNDNAWRIAVTAIEGFAHSLNYKAVEAFILHASPVPSSKDLRKYFAPVLATQDDFSMNCNSAVGGFAGANVFVDTDKFLELLASTENEVVKGYYMMWLTSDRKVKHSAESQLEHPLTELAKQADVIRAEMKKHECGFADARQHIAEEAARKVAEAEAAVLEAAKADLKEPEPEAPVENEKQEAVEVVEAEKAPVVDAAKEEAKEDAKVEEAKAEEAKSAKPAKLEKTKGIGFLGMFGKHRGAKVAEEKQAAEVAEKVAEDAVKDATTSNML